MAVVQSTPISAALLETNKEASNKRSDEKWMLKEWFNLREMNNRMEIQDG